MGSIGERIKRRRKELKMSVDELAEKIGKNRATIYRYESDEIENMPVSVLEPLAKALHVTPAYLLGWEEDENSEDWPGVEFLEDIVRLPIVGQISCGNGTWAIEEVEGYEETPRSWITSGEYFYLRAKGDSMVGARIHDGDLLLIRKQPDVADGEIAAVIIDDEAVLKRVYRQNGMLILQSENPKYPPIIVDPKNNSRNIRIIGKLKKVVIDF